MGLINIVPKYSKDGGFVGQVKQADRVTRLLIEPKRQVSPGTNADLPVTAYDLNIDLKRNQISLINGSIAQLVAGSLIGLGLFVLFLWGDVSITSLTIFGLVVVFQLTFRVFVRQVHARMEMTPENVNRVSRQMVVLAGIAGLIWGIGAFSFFDADQIDKLALLTILLLGMVSGSLPVYSAYLPVYYSFAAPTIFPFAFMCLTSGVWRIELLGLGLILTFVLTTSFARKVNELYKESLSLRHENLELISDLDKKRLIAEKASEAKTRFLAAATHDLRQPLHALGFFHSTLRMKSPLAELRPLLDKMEEARLNLVELFDGLFDNARIDLGEIVPDQVVFSVSPLANALAVEFNSHAQTDGVTVTDELENLTVKGDPVLIGRILRNLVSNGVKYSQPDADVMIRIAGDYARPFIEVQDNGPGIPEDQIEQVFEEFYRLPTDELRDVPGAGLGLSIVRQLSQILGITIELETSAQMGTKIRLYLPEGAPLELSRAPDEALANSPKTAQNVVVIDDDPLVLESLCQLLAAMGVPHIAATNVQSALTSISVVGLEPSVLLTDYDLGEAGNGFAAAEALNSEFNRDLKVVLLTALSNPDVKATAASLGYSYLQKPCSAEDLARAIG